MLLYLLCDLLCNLVLEQFRQGSAHASSGICFKGVSKECSHPKSCFSGIFSKGEFPVSTNMARVSSGCFSGVRGGETELFVSP